MKKILLVHDAELFLRMEQTVLRRRDCQIYTARAGDEALGVAREKQPDLVVLDDGLERPSSVEVCRALRADPRTARASILVAVSRSNREGIEPYLQAGANDYVIKPVSRLVFNERASRLLAVDARRFLRTLAKVEVEGDRDGGAIFGNTVNLSEAGMLVETRRELARGEHLSIQFFLPGDTDPLCLKARVVRTAQDIPLASRSYGLEFTDMTDETRLRLRAFVDERLSAGTGAETTGTGDVPPARSASESPEPPLPA